MFVGGLWARIHDSLVRGSYVFLAGANSYTIQQLSATSQADLPTLEQVLLDVQIVTDAQTLNPMLSEFLT